MGNAGPCVQLPVQRAFGKTPWELPEPSSDKEQEDLACAHSHLHTGVPYTEPALWMAKEGLLLPETQLDFISGAGPARRLWGCWLHCCSAAEACDTCRCDAPKGRRPSADPPHVQASACLCARGCAGHLLPARIRCGFQPLYLDNIKMLLTVWTAHSNTLMGTGGLKKEWERHLLTIQVSTSCLPSTMLSTLCILSNLHHNPMK